MLIPAESYHSFTKMQSTNYLEPFSLQQCTRNIHVGNPLNLKSALVYRILPSDQYSLTPIANQMVIITTV